MPIISRHALALLAVTCLSPLSIAIAHNDDGPPPPASAAHVLAPGLDSAAKRAETFNSRVPGLSNEQTAQLLAIYAAADAKIKATYENKALTNEQRAAAFDALPSEINAGVQAILTEAQRAAWSQSEIYVEGEDEKPVEKRLEKMLVRYHLAGLQLTDDQTAQIRALAQPTRAALIVVRNTPGLSVEQREAAMLEAYNTIYERAYSLFTDAQKAKWDIAQKERALKKDQAPGPMLRDGETYEQKQARVMKPFATVTGLTKAQKAKLLTITEEASDVLDKLMADASREKRQKETVAKRLSAATEAKIEAVLTKPQAAQWKKAAAASLKC